jgi:hypothetical protein
VSGPQLYPQLSRYNFVSYLLGLGLYFRISLISMVERRILLQLHGKQEGPNSATISYLTDGTRIVYLVLYAAIKGK